MTAGVPRRLADPLTTGPGTHSVASGVIPEVVTPDAYALLASDPTYDGGCPCAMFEFEGTTFDAHCWRVCDSCEFAGLHYVGDRSVALRVLAAFQAMGWGSWTIHRGVRFRAVALVP